MKNSLFVPLTILIFTRAAVAEYSIDCTELSANEAKLVATSLSAHDTPIRLPS